MHYPPSRTNSAPAPQITHPARSFANKRLSEITRADVLDLRSRLLRKCSPATVNRALGIVKVIFRETV